MYFFSFYEDGLSHKFGGSFFMRKLHKAKPSTGVAFVIVEGKCSFHWPKLGEDFKQSSLRASFRNALDINFLSEDSFLLLFNVLFQAERFDFNLDKERITSL